jgi:cytochrome c oxidase cbb3-type subunit 2
VPAVFSGDPLVQSLLSALAAAVGLVAVPEICSQPVSAADSRREDAGRSRLVAVVLSFLALIWLDSAIFATIQHTPALKAVAWPEGPRGWLLGVTHLAAALAAGWLLDRGRFRSLPWLSFALFVVGLAPLAYGASLGFGGSLLYVAGVSIYSVALVVHPSSGCPPDAVPPRWKAALLYGVAGWIGSALGIVTAERLERISPQLFVVAGVALLLASSLGAWRRLVHLAHAHRLTAAGGLAGILVYAAAARVAPPSSPSANAGSAEARGRAVYLAEGCINCHSQYIRPGTHDIEWWGPLADPEAAERPALIGNRRQGPDLVNVGLRRSALWEKLHLLDPRSVSPGSSMPSYSHLFSKGSSRGDDLVTYLASLGSARAAERAAYIESWDASAAARSVEAGGVLFRRLCTPCHGTHARGDGPLAPAIARPAMNLLKDRFWLVSWGPGTEPEPEALARVVKFGVRGSTMPGHESLTAQQVADIVAYVRSLRARRSEL